MPAATTRDLALTAIATLIWGTIYFVSTEWLPTGHPLLIGALRALPAGFVLLALTRELPAGIWWWRSLALGALNIGVFFGLLFVAAARLPGGVAATLGAIQPLLVVSLAWGLLAERPTLKTIGLAGLGLVGVSCLVLTADIQLDTIGVLAALGAAVVMAFGTVLTKAWGRPSALLSFTAWQLIAGGALLLPVALWLEPVPAALTVTHWAGFVHLALSTRRWPTCSGFVASNDCRPR